MTLDRVESGLGKAGMPLRLDWACTGISSYNTRVSATSGGAESSSESYGQSYSTSENTSTNASTTDGSNWGWQTSEAETEESYEDKTKDLAGDDLPERRALGLLALLIHGEKAATTSEGD